MAQAAMTIKKYSWWEKVHEHNMCMFFSCENLFSDSEANDWIQMQQFYRKKPIGFKFVLVAWINIVNYKKEEKFFKKQITIESNKNLSQGM